MTANFDDDASDAIGFDSTATIEERQRIRAYLDEAFSILSDGRRRSLLVALRDTEDGVAEFSDLVDRLLATESDLGPAVDDARGRFATALHHVCLPKLETAGLVEYDERSEAVRYHADARLERILEQIEAVEGWPTVPTGDGEAGRTHVPRGRWFELLSSRRRRCLLHVLAAQDEPMTLADLADEVAIREYDAALAAIPAERVLRVYLSLYHVHVPRLAASSVVSYDQEEDMVALAMDATELGAGLDAFDA